MMINKLSSLLRHQTFQLKLLSDLEIAFAHILVITNRWLQVY